MLPLTPTSRSRDKAFTSPAAAEPKRPKTFAASKAVLADSKLFCLRPSRPRRLGDAGRRLCREGRAPGHGRLPHSTRSASFRPFALRITSVSGWAHRSKHLCGSTSALSSATISSASWRSHSLRGSDGRALVTEHLSRGTCPSLAELLKARSGHQLRLLASHVTQRQRRQRLWRLCAAEDFGSPAAPRPAAPPAQRHPGQPSNSRPGKELHA